MKQPCTVRPITTGSRTAGIRPDRTHPGAGTARACPVYNFGNGLDSEDRFVVERFKTLIDGDIRPMQPEALKAKGSMPVRHADVGMPV